MKNKKGFTLVEMVVVIGMIVILTSAFAVTIVQNIQKSKDTRAAVELHYSDGFMEAKAQVEALRGAGYGEPDGYTPTPTPTPGGDTTPTPTPTTTTTPTPTPTATPTPTPTPASILPIPNPNLDISVNVTGSWTGVVVYDFTIVNLVAGTQTWDTIAFIIPDGVTVNAYWQGTYDLDGNVLSLHPYSWSESIKNKGSITITIQLRTDGVFEITEFVVV